MRRLRRANFAIVTRCEFCLEPIGSVLVTTLDGSKLHPDCYDKWRRATAAEQGASFVNGKPWVQEDKASA